MIKEILSYEITAMKDPTRGGIANALNELAEKSGKEIHVREEDIPVKEEVKAASDMLGIDPYTVANEGKIVLGVREEDAQEVLEKIKENDLGKDARIMGEVSQGKNLHLSSQKYWGMKKEQ